MSEWVSVGIVRCSLYIFRLNCSINSKCVFVLCHYCVQSAIKSKTKRNKNLKLWNIKYFAYTQCVPSDDNRPRHLYVMSRNAYVNFMFEFPCIITLYYIKNQQDATLAISFISHCKITLHVPDAFCVHHQGY